MNRTFDLNGPALINVSIEGGTVEIDTIGGNQAIVDVTLERGGEPGEDLFVGLRETHDGPEIAVDLRRRGFMGGFGHDRDLSVRIQAPHGSRVRVSSASAETAARGSYAAAAVRTASGDTMLERVDGDVELNSASGDTEIEFVGGRLIARAASGDLRVRQSAGDVSVRTASGDVEIREAEGRRVEVHTASGDVRLADVVRAAVTVQSASGDISIGVRRGSRVWVDARSLSGETHSALELSDEPDGGTPDEPLVEVRAASMSGDVEIRRAEPVPA